jgi:hypothetical protein
MDALSKPPRSSRRLDLRKSPGAGSAASELLLSSVVVGSIELT